jgi:hypothetical protein
MHPYEGDYTESFRRIVGQVDADYDVLLFSV